MKNCFLLLLVLSLNSGCDNQYNSTSNLHQPAFKPSQNIPKHMKNKELSNIREHGRWIKISDDNILTIHIDTYVPDESFTIKANIGSYDERNKIYKLNYIGNNFYQCRDDKNPTEILPSGLIFNEDKKEIILTEPGTNYINHIYN